MSDEVGTEATRSEAPGVDDSLFGEAADDKPAAVVEEEDSRERTAQVGQGSDDAARQVADEETTQDPQGSVDTEEQADPANEETPGDLKVVVSIKGNRATIGVQRPSADPHIETFDNTDLPGLEQEILAVVERARARWEEAPKNPAYERPALPVRHRSQRRQGTALASSAEGEAADAQQQTLRLF